MKTSLLVHALGVLLIVGGFQACTLKNDSVSISADSASPEIAFAVEEIRNALQKNGMNLKEATEKEADIVLSVQDENTGLEEEGFNIQRTAEVLHVNGADKAGTMYGGLELAEQIKLFGLEAVQECTQNPHMERRGTKFNIPLDARSPSYTDVCDAAQKNIPEMWNFEFWKEYIDNLARYRFNYISLWSLHPFPSMVRVPGYEGIALEDVHRSSVEWKENYSLEGMGFDAPEILKDPEIVKEISMDEKIEFWKKVMRYAKGRNIDFYVVTWNIFVNGTNGKYGITDKIDNPHTRDYFRKSVKQMFLTYPHLAGIGLTTGENMYGSDFEEKEDWAYNTYAQGVLDAAAALPNRKFTFIHRQHMAGAMDIARKFKPLVEHPNIEFLFSFKYAKAHVMSSTRQPYHENFVKEIEGMKTIWTLRNDDVYQYRWGAPDFVREFIQNIPTEVSRGFYYGSDQWIWGREFLMKDPESPRQIEIVKHWYHWMLWGRLGYNPEISNERFTQILQHRYPDIDAGSLFTAWQEASMIYPTTTGFHWGPLDFQWYIEACKSRPSYAQNETGFHDVNRFINLPPHPYSGNQSIPDYVQMQVNHGSSDLTSPLEIAKKLHAHSKNALDIVGAMNPGDHRELGFTLHDIRTMALLGEYYSHKIEGATQLALFRETGELSYQEAAVSQLTEALTIWKLYTESALEQNLNPLWTNRVGYVDWTKITEWVAEDIEIARKG